MVVKDIGRQIRGRGGYCKAGSRTQCWWIFSNKVLFAGIPGGCQHQGLCGEEATPVHDRGGHGGHGAQHEQRHLQAAQGQEEEQNQQDGEEPGDSQIWILERKGRFLTVALIPLSSDILKVKKTTEAFNNYFRDGSESKPKWGDTDVEKMPPPKFAPIKKRKSKRTIDFGRTKSAPVTPTERSPVKEVIHEEVAEENISDSDSEYGFGDKWVPEEKGVSHA